MAGRNGSGEPLSPVLRGDYTDLPPLPSQTVRLFISSTFTDMAEERNSLMKHAYPKLQKYCQQQHGLEFQTVDMRWGVRGDAADDHSTTKLCLDEIKNCQQISFGPNFVLLLGQRYGTCSLPALASGEFRSILEVADSEDQAMLEDWYKEDTNAIPLVFVLQPKSSHTGDEWSEVEQKLREILQKCVNRCLARNKMTKADATKYFSSVTELEVQQGILKSKNPNNQSLLFHRKFHNINMSHSKAWRFIDVTSGGQLDTEAQKRMHELGTTQLPKYLQQQNRFSYEVNWSDHETGGLNPENQEHVEYLTRFCQDFEVGVKKLIDQHIMKMGKLEKDQLHIEAMEHAHTCLRKCERFVGRKELLQVVYDYIENSSNHPLVIHGGSGCGKTSVLAKCANMVSHNYVAAEGGTESHAMILRFLGTTPATSTIENLLQDISKQIIRILDLPKEMMQNIPNEYDDLKDLFAKLLNSVPKNQLLVLILDSIDQLKESTIAYGVEWIPAVLPDQVKVILSVIDEGYTILDNMKKHHEIPNSNLVKVDTLTKEDCLIILETWLRQNNRQLTVEQFSKVKTEFIRDKAHKPLYLKLVYDIISVLRSYEEVLVYHKDIKKCIQAIFDKLEQKHGLKLVGHALGYLSLSKNGLSEIEMEDLLSLDDEVLTDVFQFHVPPVRRLPSILWKRIQNDLQEYLITREADSTKVLAWYHRQFIECCNERYTPRGALSLYSTYSGTPSVNLEYMQTSLKEYFAGKWTDMSKPFIYNEYQTKRLMLTSSESSALRYVQPQPTITRFHSGEKVMTRYNLRKLSELTAILAEMYEQDESDEQMMELNEHVLYNLEYLHAMLMAGRLQDLNAVASNLSLSVSDGDNEGIPKREAFLMARAIGSDAALLKQHPECGIILFSNQFLPFYNLLPGATRLVNYTDGQCREDCALVAAHQQVETAGGHAFLKIMNHIGPVNDFLFTGGGLMYSISEKIVGVGIAGAGTHVILNKRPQELPLGEQFMMIRSCLENESSLFDSSDEEINIPHGTNYSALYLTKTSGPNVFKMDNTDGSLLGKLMVDSDYPELSESQVKGLEVFGEQSTDLVLALIWYDTGHILIYDATTEKLIGHKKDASPVLGVLRDHHSDLDLDYEDLKFGFVMKNGIIACYSVALKGKSCIINENYDIQIPSIKSDEIVSIDLKSYNSTQVDPRLLFGTSNREIHVLENFSLEKGSLDEDDLSILEMQDDIVSVCASLEGDHIIVSTKSHFHLIQHNTKTISVHGENKSELIIQKSAKRSFDHLIIVGEFLVGYSGNVVEGFMVNTQEEDKIKLTRAFTINAHRLPINKLESTEEFFVTCSDDGTAKMYYSQIAVFADRHMQSFSVMSGVITKIQPGKEKALTINDSRVCAVWDLDLGNILWEVQHEHDDMLAGTLTSDENHVITVHQDGSVKIWDVSRKQDQQEPQKMLTLQHQPKQVWLAQEDSHLYIITNEGGLTVLDQVKLQIAEVIHLDVSIDMAMMMSTGVLLKHRSEYMIYNLSHRTLREVYSKQTKTLKSLDKYGRTVHSVVVYKADVLIHLSNGPSHRGTILCCRPGSKSVLPFLTDCDSSTSMDLSPSKQLLIVSTDQSMTVYQDLRPVYQGCCRMYYISPDDKYILQTSSSNDTIILVRVLDGREIGRYPLLLNISSLSISSDSKFVMAATSDKRLYIYVIADPKEDSHDERLKYLTSRQQPVLYDDPLNIIRDPRYKIIKDVTSFLEGSSDSDMIKEQFRDNLDVISSDEDNQSLKNPNHPTKTLTKKSSKLNPHGLQRRNTKSFKGRIHSETGIEEGPQRSTFQPAVRHATDLNIKYSGPILQPSAAKRLNAFNYQIMKSQEQDWSEGNPVLPNTIYNSSETISQKNNPHSRQHPRLFQK